MQSVNPFTGEVINSYEEHSSEEVKGIIRQVDTAFQGWKKSSFEERSLLMINLQARLLEQKEELAGIMVSEMGKVKREALGEIEKCALVCAFYAGNAEDFLRNEPIQTEASESYISYQPIGTVLAVMPWNFPFWQVFRFLAPALMAGNVGLLKHASNVPRCALAIEDIVRRAGFPADVFQTLLIGAEQVRAVIDDPRVKAVTLTGSEPAGRQVAAQAGKQIKKCVLELGGSDPFVVMPSADLAAAVRTAVDSRVINNGQSCIAAKRFIVDESIAGEFEHRFVEAMAGLVVGDPMLEATQVGPLATPVILHQLDEQVRRSVAAGARVLTGGCRLERPGNYYVPTVLVDAPENSPAYCEELFGPVAVVMRARGIEAAIHLANDTRFGLGASAWTRDAAEQQRFIEEIDAGMVFINGMVASDPRLPFGGVKASGYGRELAAWGIREFVNVKTVVVL